MTTGIMVCGHGSRDVEAVAEFARIAEEVTRRFPDRPVDSGFLEFARPTIRDGLEALKARGVDHILAIPGMLFAAGHVKNDIPWELNSFAAANPGVRVDYGRDLAIEPKVLRAAADRIEAALSGPDHDIERADTALVVVGRGTNDPDANANVSKVCRMLWEGMGFGWGAVAYSGVAHPRVTQGLSRVARLGFARVVVFPYFLFTGVLVKRIYAETDAVQAGTPGVKFVKARYLNDHPLVLDAFVDRVHEITAGENAMNCRLCKYRDQIIGYERDVGAPQEGHHHHVVGIGTDGDHGHHHHHGHAHHHHGPGDHGHDHDHHHHGSRRDRP
jgi:sirohydrochlorin cobaltochelatase